MASSARVPDTLGSPRTKHFLLCCPLNDRRRAARSFCKIRYLSFVLLPFSRLLILLILISSNVLQILVLPFLLCGYVTWRSRLMQCCTCSKWVHLRSTFFFSKFNHLSSCTLGAVWGPLLTNTVSSFVRPYSMYTSIVHNNLPSHPFTNTAFPQIFAYSPSFLSHKLLQSPFNLHPFLALLPRLLLLFPLFTPSEFSNRNQEVFVSELMNFFTLFCSFPAILSVSKNSTSTFLYF